MGPPFAKAATHDEGSIPMRSMSANVLHRLDGTSIFARVLYSGPVRSSTAKAHPLVPPMIILHFQA